MHFEIKGINSSTLKPEKSRLDMDHVNKIKKRKDYTITLQFPRPRGPFETSSQAI